MHIDDPWSYVGELLDRAMRQRGPVSGRGPGQPWGGIVEKTTCLWIGWVVDACRAAEVAPDSMKVTFYGAELRMTSVELTFGPRWYWLCPRCGRRCEAVYVTREVGCRVCLRLGYLSQSHRKSSAWLGLNRLNTRNWVFPQRYFPDDEAGKVVRELGKELRKDIRQMVAQVKVAPAGEPDSGE
jgi:hypothetical protein